MTWIAGTAVFATGLWLIGLALAVVLAPERTARFLRSFASSARAHYLEQILRLAAGVGMIGFASEMRFPAVFSAFGWIMAASAALLFLVPWRWHHRFGEWAIPLAIKHIRLYAVGAFALGAFILFAML